MASELVPTNKGQLNPNSRRAKIRRLIAKGHTVEEIVEKLAKGDARKAKVVRFQISKMIAEDDATILALGEAARGELVMALPETAEALGRRAKKGNVPAAKLLFETSGFWSPRSTQEHTGEIQITVKGVPRPAKVEDEPVVDATVVPESE